MTETGTGAGSETGTGTGTGTGTAGQTDSMSGDCGVRPTARLAAPGDSARVNCPGSIREEATTICCRYLYMVGKVLLYAIAQG